MKRILFLAADLCSGGAERQMVTIACLLKSKGCDVSVYCYDKADFYADTLNNAGIPIVWDLEPNNYLKRLSKVRKYIRKGHFDAVISFLPTCNLLNDVAAIGKHSWKVITGVRSASKTIFNIRKFKIINWLQSYSDHIICNSQNAKEMWVEHYPNYKNKLGVIYNTVQLGPIHSIYEPKKDDKLHIIVAATYQYLKNPLGLVEALSLMSNEERNKIKIDWYGRKEISKGDTAAFDATQKAINDKGLSGVLALNSDTQDIADKMNQADAVMLLSEFEGLPNVICEGMMIGKPIIMSRVSDFNVLVNSDNGFLCDWDNPESIKNAILSMANLSIDQLEAMGNASKRKAMVLFANDSIVDQWKKLLD